MTVFQIGDTVETLDDIIVGKVIHIDGSDITIESEDGFSLTYSNSELVKISDGIKVSNYDVAQIKSEKEIAKKRKIQTVRPKERNIPKIFIYTN